ncbi:class I heat shock protein 1 [Sesamum alatum]|uniref:Class I heat shock protein 1 n=1 Tax=Sesamum alatum TaxID=300844 RepID=A0AAE1YVP7_9LAMI|nr:class I heat shock protein 1 [Sesamum alatum]
MENVLGANRKNERRSSRNMVLEHLVPSSCWTEDADCHCLLIDLPGFKKEEVRVRAVGDGYVVVSGEREMNDNKVIRFEQSFKVPADSNIEETDASFEDGIFYLTVPKKKDVPSVGEGNQNDVSDDSDNVNGGNNNARDQKHQGTSQQEEEDEEEEEFHDAELADEWNDSSLLEKLSKKLNENRTVVLTAVLAFSLGFLVSHCCQSNAKVERSE